MHIAIDIREALKKNKAGKGWYIAHILEEMIQSSEKNTYTLYIEESQKDETVRLRGSDSRFQIRSFAAGLSWHWKVARDVEKNPPDVFFAPTSAIVPFLLNKKIKTVLVVHDLVVWKRDQAFAKKHNPKATWIEKITLPRAIKKASRIIAVSQSTKNDIQHFFKTSQGKIAVIGCAAGDVYRPIDRESLEEYRKKNNIPERFILAVGTLEPRKNYEAIIKSFHRLHKKNPDLHLSIVGGKGWHYRKIFDLITHLGIQMDNRMNTQTTIQENSEAKIHFFGYMKEEDLARLYNLAEVFAYPSFYEGFGIPPLEAMQSGCPVVVSNTSSLPEVVGDAGKKIDPHDLDALTNTLEEVLKKKEVRKQMSQSGQIQAQKFSWKKTTNDILQLFHHISP